MYSPTSSFAGVLIALALSVAPAGAVEGTPEGDPALLARSAFKAYVSGDVKRALADYRAAADLGHVGALWKVARIYEKGESGEVRTLAAYQTYSELAEMYGDVPPRDPNAVFVADAFVALGRILDRGIGNRVAPNRAAAASAFFHAASYFGDPEGQFRLGRMLVSDGRGDPQVFRRGVRWLKLASDKGHAGAIAMLGDILFAGKHVDANPVLGLSMLKRARNLAGSMRRQWIADLHEKADAAADGDVRDAATKLAEAEIARSGQSGSQAMP